MLKPIFLGLAIWLVSIGIATQGVASYETRVSANHTAAQSWNVPFVGGKHIDTPPWRPWAVMGAGIVLICWCFTMPQKIAGG